MSEKSSPKAIILFIPQKQLDLQGLLKIRILNKVKEKIILEDYKLQKKLLMQHFYKLPLNVIDTLLLFSDEELAEWEMETSQNIFLLKKTASDEIFKITLVKGLHQRFESLLPYSSLIKWNSQIYSVKKNVQTSPCSFSSYRPQFQFDVINSHNRLAISPIVILNGHHYAFDIFTQYDFWLQHNNEYFLMKFKDFQTLQWLQSGVVSQHATNASLFKEHIIAKLEADYKVNRNGHFPETPIHALPINRIFLSEISGSFLMLTPQWLYDNLLIEGVWKETQEITREGEIFVIHRNKELEADFVTLLKNLHPNFAKQSNGYFYLSFADAQKKSWFLKVFHQMLNLNIEMVGMDMLQHFRYSPHKPVTEIKIVKQLEQALTLSFSLKFGNEEIGINTLQKVLIAGQRAVLLKDGSLGIFGDDWLQQYGSIVKHGKIINKEIEVKRWMAIKVAGIESDKESTEDSILKPSINKEWWQKWSQWQKPDSEPIFKLPETICATLRPYQQKGFEWMALLAEIGAGSCLADDMGLGKTLQTICLLAHQHLINATDQHLIICPASLAYNWEQELQKFAPHFSTLVYHGAQRNFEEIKTNQPNIIITTYGTLRSDVEMLSQIEFGVIVADESHNIKNPSALITIAISQLNAKTRVALSGTPVMNNTFDLFAQLSFLLPGMFGSRDFFKKEYADPIDLQRDEIKVKALQKITAPFILRRTKEQVAKDLPEKMESVLWCQMGVDQKLAYESIKENVRNSVFLDIQEKGFGSGKLSVMAGMLKLRQVCNSGELVKDEDLFCYDSIKTDVLIEELSNLIDEHKVLVFSQFTSMIDLLEKSFDKNKIPFLRLDGSTPISKRQDLVDEFQAEDSTARVFLISLKAGNAGLNLTAADYVFLFDPWWNTAVQQQAIDRTHRIGQTKQVFAYQMICKGTIEEKIIQLQQRKKKLSEELIGEDEGFIKSLTEEDVEFLFS